MEYSAVYAASKSAFRYHQMKSNVPWSPSPTSRREPRPSRGSPFLSASHCGFSTRRSRLSGVIDRYNNRARTGTATDDGLGAAAPLAKTRPQQVQRTCGAPQFPCACHVMERQPRRHEPRPMAMIFETFTMHVPTATACLGAVGMSEARRCHLQREEELWGRTQTPGRVADYATSNRVSTCCTC